MDPLALMRKEIEEVKTSHIGRASRSATIQAISGEFKYHGLIKNVVKLSPLTAFKALTKSYGIPAYQANFITTSPEYREYLSDDVHVDRRTSWLDHNCICKAIGFGNGRDFNIDYKAWEDFRRESLRLCYDLSGLPINSSIHASGVIISKTPLGLPIDEDGVLPFNGKSLEKLGFIKYDMLSIDTLNMLQFVFGQEIDWEDTEDPKVWDTMMNGETQYVFQFGSQPMTRLLRDGKVRSIHAAAEVTAMWRPGSIQLGVPKEWVAIRNGGNAEFTKSGVMTREILKEIYGEDHTGLILYQEEVMAICQYGAGFSAAEADSIRKAMGKKDEALMRSWGDDFIKRWKYVGFLKEANKPINQGSTQGKASIPVETRFKLVTAKEAEEIKARNNGDRVIEVDPGLIWKDFIGFAAYAFNKSHAVAYTLISYHTARAWTYHQDRVLEYEMNFAGADHRKAALQAARRLGYRIIFPKYGDIGSIYEVDGETKTVFIPPMEEIDSDLLNALVSLKSSAPISAGMFDCETLDYANLYALSKKLALKSIYPELNEWIDELYRNQGINYGLKEIIELLPRLSQFARIQVNDLGSDYVGNPVGWKIDFTIRGRNSELTIMNGKNVGFDALRANRESQYKLYGILKEPLGNPVVNMSHDMESGIDNNVRKALIAAFTGPNAKGSPWDQKKAFYHQVYDRNGGHAEGFRTPESCNAVECVFLSYEEIKRKKILTLLFDDGPREYILSAHRAAIGYNGELNKVKPFTKIRMNFWYDPTKNSNGFVEMSARPEFDKIAFENGSGFKNIGLDD